MIIYVMMPFIIVVNVERLWEFKILLDINVVKLKNHLIFETKLERIEATLHG